MSHTEDAEESNSQLPVKIENNDVPVKKEDEQLVEGVIFSSKTPELIDPAILVVREISKLRYSKDELINLRESILSKKRPDFFNTDRVPASIWDPDHWNERKKSSTPTETSVKTEQPQQQDNRRRPGDPGRERVRKEHDGIVLSPQRRSFNSGCFVPTTREQPQSRNVVTGSGGSGGPRSHSPIKSDGNPHSGIREIQSGNNTNPGGNRRIGSGRIIRDNWDFNEKNDTTETDYYRNNQDDRRTFRRDYETSKNERRNVSGRFGNSSRRISNSGDKDEEPPEWFSGGPISQNDTIELRGFDENEKNNINNSSKKKLNSNSSQAKRVREWAKKKNGTVEDAGNGEKDDNSGVAGHAKGTKGSGNVETSNTQDGGAGKDVTTTTTVRNNQERQNDNDKENRNILSNNAQGNAENLNEQSFLFDDIFKFDSIPGLLNNEVEGTTENNTKSRFSRWFKQESPEKMSNSRRSSLQDEHLVKNLLNDINEPATVAIPPQLGNSESYFAPISPAAVNSGNIEPGAPRPGQVNIAEMFQRSKMDHQSTSSSAVGGKIGADTLNNIKSHFPGKVMSLNELESRMRKNVDNSTQVKSQQLKSEDEITAFKRLMAQVTGGLAVTANNASQQKFPMSLMEMLSHSQQQDEVRMKSHLIGAGNGSGNGGGSTSPKTSTVHNEFLIKMQQAQQEQQLQRQQQINMLNKLMVNVGAHVRNASPLQEYVQQQSRELLNRPEAQAILQGLKRGDFTPQHLYQQLANPALQPRHRELLCAILKMQRMGPSPRVLSPVPPPPPTHHNMFSQQQQQPQQQQLRVSPLPNAMHQRIPSPRELQVHTQNILQRALIKKKLEEQQENFRKKQEMQQPIPTQSTNNKSVSSPTPLAFTPTSVLRKMTADKEDGNKDSKNLETKFPQGRPVIGARIQQQQQPPNLPQTGMWNNPQYHSKQPGRPIVKANNSYQNTGPEQFFNAHQQQQQFLFNQRQQQLMNSQQNSGVSSSMGNIGQYTNQTTNQPNQQFPQLTQQQLRAQHQQQARPSTTVTSQQQQPPAPPKQQQNYQPQQQNNAWQQFLNAATSQQSNNNGRNAMCDGDLSPTSNQLARWFSSDLLERARGGELPSTAGLAQHAVSLEEIERQSAPPVHN